MRTPISQQVVVITGASSGIGREAALQFARRGAAVVLAARNRNALDAVAAEIAVFGGRAHVVPTDVSDPQQVDNLATEAVNTFGRIDTWVNDAAVTEYATFEQTTDEEFRRIVDVNLMGTVYGARAALRHMKPRRTGTIINIGSVESDRALPLNSAYAATKQAMKGFTDALRMELEHERAGISVTLIQPGSINTPLFEHARSKMDGAPKPPPPIYQPSVVADAILRASEHPVREIYAGGFAKFLSVMHKISPRLVDWYMTQGGRMFEQQKDPSRPASRSGNLEQPFSDTGAVHGRFGDQAHARSLYTSYVEPRPMVKRVLAGVFVAGAAAALIGIGRATKRSPRRREHRLAESVGKMVGSAQAAAAAVKPRKREIVYVDRDPRETLARDAYVPVVQALLKAGIDPKQVPGFDRVQAKFLDRLRTAADLETARYEAEAEQRSHPGLRERLGRRLRRLRSRPAGSTRGA